MTEIEMLSKLDVENYMAICRLIMVAYQKQELQYKLAEYSRKNIADSESKVVT